MYASDGSTDVGASVFAFLGSEIRLQILDALYKRTVGPGPMANTVTYSTIREDVGIEDSGRFNYHLDKLTGQFVEQYNDGYRLREAGREVIRIHRTGILSKDPTIEFEPIDATCYFCGANVEVGYDDGQLVTRCPGCQGGFEHELAPKGTLTILAYPPSGVESNDLETAFRRAHRRFEHQVVMMGNGFCTRCGADVSATIRVCDDERFESMDTWAEDPTATEESPDSMGEMSDWLHYPGVIEFTCQLCGIYQLAPPLQGVLDAEPVATILAERDVEPGWERLAELIQWPVVAVDGRLGFEAPTGELLIVTEDLEVSRQPSKTAE
ncbi:DUF7351 domain-containing protein [Halorubrum vacuolatum]|uniref:Uncharacterized protein n=1 Tax=Halorubrum vacuolatum TaxID=63740 RepID=A0A238VMG8_HALVU|nr:hypothetical protein [Halorubrum vacuolatum]SNR35381.1 hypothetical protein SAMN06264855_103117 [Halorubrum vacuolatum]